MPSALDPPMGAAQVELSGLCDGALQRLGSSQRGCNAEVHGLQLAEAQR